MADKQDVLASILKEYDQRCSHYQIFTDVTKKLVDDILKSNDLRVHSVTARVKDRIKLEDKVIKDESKYKILNDVTDISGVRIITYFADEVDMVSEIITKEFDIDKEYSVDKRELLDPDRFGYLSLHYIVKFLPVRLQLAEYKAFSDCQCEIQIRSILQHAWAEIQHDLGYKSKQAVPREIQRRFSRLAGLLELADDEFLHIREDVDEYQKHVSEQIKTVPSTIMLDQISLEAFINGSTIVQYIDRNITKGLKAKYLPQRKNYTSILNGLRFVGINNIQELEQNLSANMDMIPKLAIDVVGRLTQSTPGISLFWLCYVKVLQTASTHQAILEFLSSVTRTKIDSDTVTFAQKMFDTYNKITKV